MIWSGLRGAVGLALAIMVDAEPGISKRDGSLIMFHVGGMAALTMIVNATSTAPLLKKLGLTKDLPQKQRMMMHFKKEMEERAEREIHRRMKAVVELIVRGANGGENGCYEHCNGVFKDIG